MRSGSAPTRSRTPTNSAAQPREEYERRLAALSASLSRLKRRDNVLAAVKLAVGLIAVASGLWLAKFHPRHSLVVLSPVALLLLLFVVHERVLKKLRRFTRSQAFYQQGMARLEDRWVGQGNAGERFLDPAHPYARDLDLFGKGSLFELLATTRTRIGEETLASWLLAPAPIQEVRRRQETVRQLTPKLDLRERMALAGEDARRGSRPESLAAWSVEHNRSVPRFGQAAMLLLAFVWLASMVAWIGWGEAKLAIVASLLNFAISYGTRARVSRAAEEAEAATQEVGLIAAVFAVMEEEQSEGASSQGRVSPRPASALGRLGRLADWLASSHNYFVRIFDGFIFFTPQCVAVIEAWRRRHGAEVPGWLMRLGRFEALCSFAGYAYEHPQNVFPELAEGIPLFDAEALCHPLLPPSKAVPNDLELGDGLKLLVISGPNMAGKSTFVRAVGLNAVLAQAGAPVPSRRLTLSTMQVAASISIVDSLQGGLSRFYAEIKRLKQIEELSKGPLPVLFLLDELLSGTNSHDRRMGTEAVLRTLLARGSTGMVTTHDLALTAIAEGWQGRASNLHFEDTFLNGELHFDYRLAPGIAHTTNALALMRSIGLDVPDDSGLKM